MLLFNIFFGFRFFYLSIAHISYYLFDFYHYYSWERKKEEIITLLVSYRDVIITNITVIIIEITREQANFPFFLFIFDVNSNISMVYKIILLFYHVKLHGIVSFFYQLLKMSFWYWRKTPKVTEERKNKESLYIHGKKKSLHMDFIGLYQHVLCGCDDSQDM